MRPMFSIWLFCLVFLLAVTLVQAAVNCSDVLTFNYNGHSRLPQNPSDYDTSVDSIRVIAVHQGAFSFPNVSQNYFYAAVDNYSVIGINVSTILYQYTPGTDYYYAKLNASSVPWFCDLGKMADLSVSNTTLNGAFEDASGEPINASSVPVLVFDASVENGFFIPNFGTMRKLLVVMRDGVKELPGGYIVYPAKNGVYVATGFKQAQFYTPATPVAFCLELGSACLDASGLHGAQCQGRGLAHYSCYAQACIGNLTSCSFGCKDAACLESLPTPSANVAIPNSSVSIASAVVVEPTISAKATTPSGLDAGLWELLIPVAVIVAGIYYFLGRKRRPKGL